MTELIKLYYQIMARYRNGEFGKEHLVYHEILKRAGEPDLFARMSVEELVYLRDRSFGMKKWMFSLLISEKNKSHSVVGEEQSFDVSAVPNDKAFVVTTNGMENLTSKKSNPEVIQQIEAMVTEFKANNLSVGNVVSPAKKKIRKP